MFISLIMWYWWKWTCKSFSMIVRSVRLRTKKFVYPNFFCLLKMINVYYIAPSPREIFALVYISLLTERKSLFHWQFRETENKGVCLSKFVLFLFKIINVYYVVPREVVAPLCTFLYWLKGKAFFIDSSVRLRTKEFVYLNFFLCLFKIINV